MKIIASALLGLATLIGAASAMAEPAPLRGFVTVLPVTKHLPASRASTTALPSFTYSVTASADLGGATYTGTILGKSPSAKSKGTTRIKVMIVPLAITINDGKTTVVYDPTQPDACNGNHTAVADVMGSPIFTKDADFVMNGVDMGKTQYVDAFQRAEFWSEVGGTNYHLLFQPKVLAAQALSFTGKGNGVNLDATKYKGCGTVGVVNLASLDSQMQALITGPLASMINTGTFPIFITRDVVSSEKGVNLNYCCVLGYHSGFNVGSNLQIYSPFAFDASGLFGADVTTLSHEMAEAVNDPTGGNPTPAWGHIGQVPSPYCQSNFEVGDPLSEGYGTPTTPFVTTGANGLTYHMQELAFFSWYFGTPSLGAGGKFSDNGSFAGDHIPCTATTGGTN